MAAITKCVRMNSEEREELHLYEVPALGRPVELGQLYDARTDQFGADVLKTKMADDITITKHGGTSFATFEKDEMSSITSSWGISADLQVSVMSEAVQCGGSVRYLNDSGRFSGIYSSAAKVTIETEIRQLKNRCKKYCKGQTAAGCGATHFVYKIQYGSEALFLFSESRKTEVAAKAVGGGVTLKSFLPVGASVNVNKQSSSTNRTEVFRCVFYGDFRPDVLPGSCGEAKSLCQDMPSKSDNIPYSTRPSVD